MTLHMDAKLEKLLRLKIKSKEDALICIDCLSGFFDDSREQKEFINFCIDLGDTYNGGKK